MDTEKLHKQFLEDLDRQIAEASTNAKAVKAILDSVTNEEITVKEGADQMERLKPISGGE